MEQAAATERLEAIEAIRSVLGLYCRAIDRLDAELLRSVYHADAYDDHGPFKGNRDDFIAWIIPFLRREYVVTSHHVTTQNIEVDGDVAYAESYAIVVQDKIAEGIRRRLTAHARYLDVIEKRDGKWAIARRMVITDSASSQDAPPWTGTTPIEQLGGGTRDRDDPSYALFRR
jgi:ketosteroid isomerase-like protein